ncbi:TLC domain-containing 2 [Labeo rohita]|uniref:TLC domain-containing 2 n=1 Tax=Labeo rohita TaxID=84645 RepID=A0A498M6H0_LABRO|nr:TLC domain-containing 2 [Labeo rohita]
MAEDLIETYSVFSHALVSVSIGYFIYDFFDMVMNQKITHSWELLFHHVVVITCFGISVLTCRYVGFAVVALLVEINSIFLHLRQVLRMANLAKSTFYRVNSMINLGTYVVFRINTLAWMTRWLVLNRDLIPLISYTIGSVGLAIMTVMNIVLFYRLMRSDFMKSSREKDVRKEKEKEICIIALVLKEPLPAACHRDDEDDAVQQTQDTRARLCQLNVGITLIDRDIVGYSNCTLARTTKD